MSEPESLIPLIPPPSPEVEASATASLSQTERIVSTFTSPEKTFKDVARNSSWWAPFLLTVITSLLFVIAIHIHIGWEKVADNQMKLNPKQAERMANMSPEQAAQTRHITAIVTEGISYFFPVFMLLTGVVIAGVLLATINFGFGGQAKFGNLLAALFYSWLPGLIKTLLSVVVIFFSDPDTFQLSNPIGTNPAYYLNLSETPLWLYGLLSSFDIFTIWTMVLLAIGVATVAKVKKGAGYAAVFGWWVLIILVKTAWSAVAS